MRKIRVYCTFKFRFILTKVHFNILIIKSDYSLLVSYSPENLPCWWYKGGFLCCSSVATLCHCACATWHMMWTVVHPMHVNFTATELGLSEDEREIKLAWILSEYCKVSAERSPLFSVESGGWWMLLWWFWNSWTLRDQESVWSNYRPKSWCSKAAWERKKKLALYH